MSLDAELRKRLAAVLSVVDEHETRGPRLLDDAARLWRRVERFVAMNLIPPGFEVNSLELACHALQLPLRDVKLLPIGKLGRTNLRDRCEQAAELLVTLLGEDVEEESLDRTTRLLHEMPQRAPMLDEARLLADAVNLEDFGTIGLFTQMIQLTRQGDGLTQLAEGCRKREQYGYWEARLKDGFHFEPVREMARQRLENVRAACRMLNEELRVE